MKTVIGAAMTAAAAVARGGDLNNGIGMATQYEFECYGPDGQLKWRESFKNLVTDAGLNDVLDKYFKGSTYTAAFYVGLKLTGSVIAADTMASHSGWAEESAAYSEATRPTLTLGTVASESVDNSASKAAFSITGTATITGAFLTDTDTKGGATGLLYGGGEFAADKSVSNGDTLNVTLTLTSAAV